VCRQLARVAAGSEGGVTGEDDSGGEDGQRQVFIPGPVGPRTTKRDTRELQAVLDSIRFDT
jgi:hypothetical protein